MLKQILVASAAEELEVRNLKIAPVMAQTPAVTVPVTVAEPAHHAPEWPWHP
jgi:hypothetical protein